MEHRRTQRVKWVDGKMRGDMMGEKSDGDEVNVTRGGAIIECGKGLWWKKLRVRGACDRSATFS